MFLAIRRPQRERIVLSAGPGSPARDVAAGACLPGAGGEAAVLTTANLSHTARYGKGTLLPGGTLDVTPPVQDNTFILRGIDASQGPKAEFVTQSS